VVLPGGAFTGQVAHGTDAYPGGVPLGDFTAVVNWGDGTAATTCTSCVTATGGDFMVAGTHQYAKAGYYWVETSVTDGTTDIYPGGETLIIVPIVAEPFVSGEGAAFNGEIGTVLHFTQEELAKQKLASLSVTVNWGDGSDPTSGVLGTSVGGVSTVSGSHTYGDEGTYTITLSTPQTGLISLHSAKVAKVAPKVTSTLWIATASVSVADAPITASSVSSSLTGTAGTPFSGVIAHVVDSASNGLMSDLSAVIDWGDGTTSAGTLTPSGSGGYDISGTHTYTTTGPKLGVVKVVDIGGSKSQAPFSVTVGGASSGVQGIIGVPNTGGGELPLGPGLLLVAAGGALFTVGRLRRK
jgi:hypothetical protein